MMPTMQQLEELLLKADAAGDETAARTAALAIQDLRKSQAQMTHARPADKREESELTKLGRTAPTSAQAALKAGDVLSFGLGKKMLGPDYSDFIKGATSEFKEQYPATSFGMDVVGSMPAGMIGVMRKPIFGSVEQAISMPERIARAGATSSVQSGLTGLGQSEADTVSGQLSDAAQAAGIGALMGGGTAGMGAVAGQMMSPVAQAASRQSANTAAARRYALALQRDLPEGYQGSISNFARNRLNTLGPEAALADVGESTIGLADIMATLPGKAKNTFENLIEQRQQSRAGRLMAGADESLGTQGAGYTQTLKALAAKKMANAEPFYNVLQYAKVPVDDELFGLLKSAGKEALVKSKRLSRLAGENQISLEELEDSRDIITNALIPGKQLDFKSLDRVKQSLYDLESKFARAGEKQEAAAFANLRRRLTAKLDELSPTDDAGESIYAKARNAFAGPAQMEDAVVLGRESFKGDPLELEEQISALSQSELEAFRIGAIQALREKTGTESGQTGLLKYWKEPKTSDALRRIFGDKFDTFKATLDAERDLKKLERVGRGSQTASREFAAGELNLDPVMDAGQMVASGMTPSNLASWAGRQWNRVSMPEKTRNQLAALLSQQGSSAQRELDLLDVVLQNMNRSRARSSALAGALGSAGYTNLGSK